MAMLARFLKANRKRNTYFFFLFFSWFEKVDLGLALVLQISLSPQKSDLHLDSDEGLHWELPPNNYRPPVARQFACLRNLGFKPWGRVSGTVLPFNEQIISININNFCLRQCPTQKPIMFGALDPLPVTGIHHYLSNCNTDSNWIQMYFNFQPSLPWLFIFVTFL